MAASDEKPSLLMGTIVPMLVLTLVAGGGGALIGTQIVSALHAGAVPAKAEAVAPSATTQTVKELAPIVTNLSYPDGSWVRLQTAMVYDKSEVPQADVMAARIGQDILAFVKTLTMAQLQGATGLQSLREDLNERASLRSDGHVRELMIEMLVVQ